MPANSTEPVYSGLYSYHVPTSTWTALASDIARPSPPNVPVIRSRVGHSMLFHPVSLPMVRYQTQRSTKIDRFHSFSKQSLRSLGIEKAVHIRRSEEQGISERFLHLRGRHESAREHKPDGLWQQRSESRTGCRLHPASDHRSGSG